jgi:hypothetical protein
MVVVVVVGVAVVAAQVMCSPEQAQGDSRADVGYDGQGDEEGF